MSGLLGASGAALDAELQAALEERQRALTAVGHDAARHVGEAIGDHPFVACGGAAAFGAAAVASSRKTSAARTASAHVLALTSLAVRWGLRVTSLASRLDRSRDPQAAAAGGVDSPRASAARSDRPAETEAAETEAARAEARL